eukprot:3202171-Ditylum_brightwellii.AAC.1
MEKNKTMTIDEVYPEHMEALQKAGLTSKKFPRLEDLQLKEDDRKNNKEEETNERADFRTIYFVLSHSKSWGNSTVTKTIKQLKKQYKLIWLRVQMAYSCFPNIRKHLMGT